MTADFLARNTHPARDVAALEVSATETTPNRARPADGLLGRSGGILVALVFAAVLAGCGPAQQTRSQTLQDYKTEVELLDRLEAKRASEESEYRANMREMDQAVILLPEGDRQRYAAKLAVEKEKREKLFMEETRLVIEPQQKRVREAAASLNGRITSERH